MLFLRRVAVMSVLAFAGLLFVASQASATTYCAVISGSLPDCTAGNTSTGANNAVQDALDDAMVNPGPDKVVIGAGTFSRASTQSFFYNAGAGGNGVEITGQGPSTILQPTGDPALNYVLVISASASTSNSIHDLRINIPSTAGSNTAGLVVSTNSPTDVNALTVTAPSPLGSTVGVSLGSPGSVLRNSNIDIARFGVATQGTFGAVSAVTSGSAPVIRDSTISADYGVSAGAITSSSTDEKILASNLRITATVGAYSNQAGHMTIDDSLIRLLPDAVSPSTFDSVGLSSFSFLGGTAQITGRHVTVVGGVGTRDIGAQAFASSATANVDLLLKDSVLTDVETSLKRRATEGVATLSSDFSNFNPATIVDSNAGPPDGSGIVTLGSGNVNVSPGFVDAGAGDFSLSSSSGMIDAGDPATLQPSEPVTDIAGNPRVTDGDGNGTARRDMGAFEFQPAVSTPDDTTPPNTIGGKFKKKIKAGKKAKFKFSSDDPTATFVCAYDGGDPRACSSPYVIKKPKKGKHVLAITARDAMGNFDSSPVVNRFKVTAKKSKK